MPKEIYLDNAATTPLDKKVMKAMEAFWFKIYGNPSSPNQAGEKAKMALEGARKKIANILGTKSQEIIFTSSATEANNLAIFGLAKGIKKRLIKLDYKNKKFHIITTKIEHRSVLNPLKELEKDGFEVTYLPVDQEGIIRLDDLKNSLTKNTILVSGFQK